MALFLTLGFLTREVFPPLDRHVDVSGVDLDGVDDPPLLLATYHKMSPKHLDRYIAEFTGRHNIRDLDTRDQMHHLATGMIGRRLTYRDLIAKGESACA